MPDGKVAIVTGAAHGIGRAIAQRLAHDGWRVVGVDRDPVEEFAGLRGVLADVGDETEIGALVADVVAREGGLDAIVSNAGYMVRKPLAALTLAEWSGVLTTNLTALFLLARAGEAMLRAAKGGIVAVASTRAHQSEANTESYSASKGGLVALTHALAISLGPDIRVNCISPGWIDVAGDPLSEADATQHPVGRVGRPEDVAAMTAFLLSSESGFVTGAEFVVDGGMTRKMIYV
ncbi:MAG: SDR family oxidoreductase [Janthinobacterium lividum]